MELIGVAVPCGSGTGDVVGISSSGSKTQILLGYAIAETASVASDATIQFHHGQSVNSPILTPEINLLPDGYIHMNCYIHCPHGVFINRLLGKTDVVLYVSQG